jgi:hypothetical protein
VRRAILSFTLPILLVAGVSRSDAGGLDLRVGAFFPRGRDCGIPSSRPAEYTLFQDVCELYVPAEHGLGDMNWKSEFNGVYGGIEFNQVITDYVEVGVSYDYYAETVDTSYRDYEWDNGDEIRQQLRLRMSPLGATVRFLPTSKKAKIVPYVGGGIDAIFYKYEEHGDFVCFPPASGECRFDYDVVPDGFRGESVAFGYHALGGLRVYLNRDFAIVGEGRYQWGKDVMNDDFSPNAAGLENRIDLSGWTATVGLHVRF